MKLLHIAYYRRNDGTFHGVECETITELFDQLRERRILWVDEVEDGGKRNRGHLWLRRTLNLERSVVMRGYRME